MTQTPQNFPDVLIEAARILMDLALADTEDEARVRVSSALQTLTSCSLLEGQLATEVVFSQGGGE